MGAVEIAETGEVTVTIVGNVRCVHDETVYTDGDEATVPVAVGHDWIGNGWATEPAAKAEVK